MSALFYVYQNGSKKLVLKYEDLSSLMFTDSKDSKGLSSASVYLNNKEKCFISEMSKKDVTDTLNSIENAFLLYRDLIRPAR